MTVRTHDDARQNLTPSVQNPADRTIFGWVAAAAIALWRAVDDLYCRIQNRRRFEAMLELEDSLLNDIGVTRDEVRWASRLPLSYSAGDELRRASGRRIRRSE